MTEAVNEFRARPVVRYNLTHYRRDDQGSSSRTIGEFTQEVAVEVGGHLRDQIPGATFLDETGEKIPSGHTLYPSRYPLGSRLVRKQTDVRATGIGERGTLHRYEAEEAEVIGIHFYPGKVCYDVAYPNSNRPNETIDSYEVQGPAA